VEAFKIPSKSMVPTLMVGDHIFVNKFIYGIRLPLTKKWIARFKTPERGEVIVFIYPRNESLDFIKRVVGLPGDKVKLKGDELFVNDEKVGVTTLNPVGADPKNPRILDAIVSKEAGGKEVELPFFREWKQFNFFIEKLGVASHLIQEEKDDQGGEMERVVPPGFLFVMGDNRDNSSDSREWGFVPMDNVKGRAMFIWLSPDLRPNLPLFKSLLLFFKDMRWERLGKWIE
jgi:signal peptidase I